MHQPRIFKLVVLAAALAAGSVAMAQQDTAPRDQRMNESLQTYRNSTAQNSQTSPSYSDAAAKNPQPGPAARAEESTKRGARNAGNAVKHGAQRTGQAIKHGAQRTGDAIGTGMEKSGAAVRRGGEKLKDKSAG